MIASLKLPWMDALGRGAVVADDVVDQRVIQQFQVVQGLHQPADLGVGVGQEPGVDLHLAGQHRLEVVGHLVPVRDLRVERGQLGVGRDHAELLLPFEDLLAQRVPAGVEAARVPVGPLLGGVVRGVGRAGGEVQEERAVRLQRVLAADPVHAVIGEVLGQVVALLRGAAGLHRGGALVQGGVVLVGLPADEAVEVLKTAAGRPAVERAGRAGLPHRHLVALADLRGGVAVEPQRLGQRGLGVGPDRVVSGRGGGQFGDGAHADRVVVAAGQQRLPGRRAQRGGVEPGVAQPAVGQPLRHRGVDRAAEHAGGAEAHVVEQDHQDVRRAGRRPQRRDRRERRLRVPGVVRGQPGPGPVGHGQGGAGEIVMRGHRAPPVGNR